MGNSPVIFNGRRSKLLTADGLLTSVGRTLDFDGSINYIANKGAEVNTTGWATYADAAGTSPVDGTGGSPSSTFTRSTSSPLRGQGSFLWTKSAANRQGEGFSYDFTIDASDKAKVIQISFDYLVSSGTYADSDMTIWIYDVTNAALIQPAGYTIQNASVSMKQLATFQSASNSTSYRLIVHTASTSASAYTLQFDNFAVGPQIVTNGAAVTDWVSFTPTGSWSTNTTYTGLWRRIGDSMEIQAKALCSGAPTSAGLYFNMPSGFTIDSNKIPSGISTNGVASMQDSGAASYVGEVQINVTANTFYVYTTANPSVNVTQAVPFTFGANDYVSINVVVPITGWSSNVQLSSDTDTRVVAARVKHSASQTGVNPNNSAVKVNFNSVTATSCFDTHGAYDTSAFRYNVAVPGKYEVAGLVALADTNILNNRYIVLIYKNGAEVLRGDEKTQAAATYVSLPFAGSIDAVSGDYIEVYLYGVGNNSASTLTITTVSHLNISRLSGPAVVAASETVSFSATAPGALTTTGATIIYGTKSWDSHGGYNTSTGEYTIPVSGIYNITCGARTASTSMTVGHGTLLAIYVDGALSKWVASNRTYATNSIIRELMGTCQLRLLAGQKVKVFLGSDTSVALDTSTDAFNYFAGTRIGNF